MPTIHTAQDSPSHETARAQPAATATAGADSAEKTSEPLAGPGRARPGASHGDGAVVQPETFGRSAQSAPGDAEVLRFAGMPRRGPDRPNSSVPAFFSRIYTHTNMVACCAADQASCGPGRLRSQQLSAHLCGGLARADGGQQRREPQVPPQATEREPAEAAGHWWRQKKWRW